VVRGPKREVISRAYNLLLHAALHNGFSDAQCGFKAVRADVARVLVPMVADEAWFFDTELLVLAEHNGLRIHEVPVDWVDDPDSRVAVVGTALADVAGVWRMVRRLGSGGGLLPAGALRQADRPTPALAGQLVRFAGVGTATTAVFADLLALAVAAVANLAANRRVTFAARGSAGRARHWRAGLAVAAAPLLANVVVVLALGPVGRWVDLLALCAVNAAATAGRFVLLRRWVFGR
jgi:hypothetical protein